MINCNVVNNEASETCGGLYNESSYNRIYNSVFWGNTVNGTPQQLSGSSKFSYCAVQGGVTGTNIIDLSADNEGSGMEHYPFFVDPDNGDYGVLSGSALIDVGNKTVSGVSGPDFLGNQRIVGEQIDLGAVEFQGALSSEDVTSAATAVFPNPIDNRLYVRSEGLSSVIVYNAHGQRIISLESDGSSVLDTTEWPNGVYFVSVDGEVTKVIK